MSRWLTRRRSPHFANRRRTLVDSVISRGRARRARPHSRPEHDTSSFFQPRFYFGLAASWPSSIVRQRNACLGIEMVRSGLPRFVQLKEIVWPWDQ